MDLATQLDLLLGDFSHLEPRIRHREYKTTSCGDRIDVRCSYIAFRDGKPTFDDFINIIATHIVSFCLPRRDISKARATILAGDHVAAARTMAELSEKARTLFIKAKKGSHRSGEAGEIVLYILTEWLLKAPQIVSKMYLKTNNNMPVYGTDGIHARFDTTTNKLHLYWGESKAHVKIASALSSALDSISEFLVESHDKREIEIISSFPDFDNMDKDSIEAFMKYLDPYSEQSNERIAAHSCLLIFEHAPAIGTKADEAESAFLVEVDLAIEEFINSIKGKIEAKGLSLQRFEFFLMPVPSVQNFRDKFQEKIGWPT